MREGEATPWIRLSTPSSWPPEAKSEFLRLARSLQDATTDERTHSLIHRCSRHGASTLAGASLLADLAQQGWPVRIEHDTVEVHPPAAEMSPEKQKERVRNQELMRTQEQLRSPSVRRFIAHMESPHEYHGQFVSIFELMRDGEQLAGLLDHWNSNSRDPSDLHALVAPYVQVVQSGERCHYTGFKLTDIWRYFRHTWTNPSTSTPGRTMLLLVRDAAAPFHPVIGIASLASPVVQIQERDQWIGWQSQQIMDSLHDPSTSDAFWLLERLEHRRSELYVDDLIRDELYWPDLWACPHPQAVALLREESRDARRDHNRFARRRDFQNEADDAPHTWRERAESDLYRSKRCQVLADLLECRMALLPFLSPEPHKEGLKEAMRDSAARKAVMRIARFTRAETVGTEVADLTVCGAVAPYNELLGGKLISMLAVSPTAVAAYHDRYGGHSSQIASSLAGRPIKRTSRLAFIGTTSLYGAGSSQYNRVRIPGHVLGSHSQLEFTNLGRSRSFGTSHFSARTVDTLVRLAEQERGGQRLNSIFGEGASPKLRKLRHGIALLGWPADELLQHRRERVVYGVSLVTNLKNYLLCREQEPHYRFDTTLQDDVARLADWWTYRWLSMRAQKQEILDRVAQHNPRRPVDHGAKVHLPPLEPSNEPPLS